MYINVCEHVYVCVRMCMWYIWTILLYFQEVLRVALSQDQVTQVQPPRISQLGVKEERAISFSQTLPRKR